MLTSENEIQIAEQALAMGANCYITKPFDLEYLKKDVLRLLVEKGGAPCYDGTPWRHVPE